PISDHEHAAFTEIASHDIWWALQGVHWVDLWPRDATDNAWKRNFVSTSFILPSLKKKQRNAYLLDVCLYSSPTDSPTSAASSRPRRTTSGINSSLRSWGFSRCFSKSGFSGRRSLNRVIMAMVMVVIIITTS
ncbi:hypothetical protein T310_8653, partial [Rasamsonia emersonii CBS 393.64]